MNFLNQPRTAKHANDDPSCEGKKEAGNSKAVTATNPDLKEDRSVNFAKVVDGKRVFTIAYRMIPGRSVSNIEYAASVFRQDMEKETYTRKKHVQTARGRLAVRPLCATFDFSRPMLDVLFERDVPTDKAERRAWGQSESGRQWKDSRRAMDTEIANFLRKQISKHGVRAPQRLTRSQQRS